MRASLNLERSAAPVYFKTTPFYKSARGPESIQRKGVLAFDTQMPGFYHERDTSQSSMPPAFLPPASAMGRTFRPSPGSREPCSGFFPAKCALVLIFLFTVHFAPPGALAQSPDQIKVTGYVSDFANVLSPAARARLAALCAEVDQKAQAQIAVVTIKSLDGKPIEDYAVELFGRIGVGNKQTNRGVLILLAVGDHLYKFEVGYGLESILPDGKVGGFGREAVPYLRQNDYDAALLLMTSRVAAVIASDRGVKLTGSAAPPPPENSTGNLGLAQIFLLFFAIFIVFSILRRAGGGPGSRFGGGGWAGPMIGGAMGGWGGGGFGGGGGGGFGGFGGGSSGGGGASGSW